MSFEYQKNKHNNNSGNNNINNDNNNNNNNENYSIYNYRHYFTCEGGRRGGSTPIGKNYVVVDI